MKHLVKSFVLGSVVSTCLVGTASAAELMDKGVKLGLNMASVTGADAEPAGVTNSSRTGFSIGGFGTWGLNDKLSIQSEALYTQKGVVMSAAGTETPLSLSYLEVPISMQYSMPVSGLNINLFAGPYMGMLLSADSDGTDVKDNTKAFDYGFQLGAGTIINKKYSLDARYSMGLASIDDSGAEADMKNSGILISGGYLF